MIYCPPHDRNVTALARFIRTFRVLPLCGMAHGLRQPVHADDLVAASADAVNATAAFNCVLDLPGGETLTFRAMAGRIFRALGMTPIMLPLPRIALEQALRLYERWRPSGVESTGLPERFAPRVIAFMNTDMVVDAEPARMAFGYRPRSFAPVFPPDF